MGKIVEAESLPQGARRIVKTLFPLPGNSTEHRRELAEKKQQDFKKGTIPYVEEALKRSGAYDE